MSGQHNHTLKLQPSQVVDVRLTSLAIAAGFLLVGCTPPETAVAPTPSPTVTGNPTPTATVSPGPSLSPSASSPVMVSPTPGKPENVTKIETQVIDLITKTANLTVQSVDCPAAIAEKSGKTYDCQVQSEAGPFVVVVQPTGEAGKFRWGTRGLLLLSKLDTFIQQSVTNQGGGKVTVDCGTKARTAKPGESFDCKVTDAKGTVKTARITVRDDQGNVYLSGL